MSTETINRRYWFWSDAGIFMTLLDMHSLEVFTLYPICDMSSLVSITRSDDCQIKTAAAAPVYLQPKIQYHITKRVNNWLAGKSKTSLAWLNVILFVMLIFIAIDFLWGISVHLELCNFVPSGNLGFKGGGGRSPSCRVGIVSRAPSGVTIVPCKSLNWSFRRSS